MKVAVAFALMLACVCALPNKAINDIDSAIRSGDERIVTGQIISAIEDAAQAIADAGLDPLNINQQLAYALPVPSIFNGHAFIDNLLFTGASNIVVNRMNYALLTSRLTFNIELPEIALSVADSEADLNIFGKNYNSRFRGSVAVRNIVLTGNIRVSVGILSGISISSMEIGFSLGGIDSQLFLSIQGADFSRSLNQYLGVTIPTTLREFQRDIDLLLSIVGKDLADRIL